MHERMLGSFLQKRIHSLGANTVILYDRLGDKFSNPNPQDLTCRILVRECIDFAVVSCVDLLFEVGSILNR